MQIGVLICFWNVGRSCTFTTNGKLNSVIFHCFDPTSPRGHLHKYHLSIKFSNALHSYSLYTCYMMIEPSLSGVLLAKWRCPGMSLGEKTKSFGMGSRMPKLRYDVDEE